MVSGNFPSILRPLKRGKDDLIHVTVSLLVSNFGKLVEGFLRFSSVLRKVDDYFFQMDSYYSRNFCLKNSI